MQFFNTHKRRTKNGGYIALMATIIIALVLLVMIVREGFSGWMTRFAVLGTEAKEQANALAEGCADQALASLITDPTYLGNTTSTMPAGVCRTFAIDPSQLAAGLVTIKTQAVVRDAFANLELLQNVNSIHLGAIPTAPTYGTIIVQTLVSNPASGAQLSASDFTMNVASINPSKSSFPGSATGVVVTIPTGAGTVAYSVSETLVPGYAPLATAGCSGSIKGGDIKSCTISNSPVTTTLTLIANVSNNDGTGTAAPADIALYIDGVQRTMGQAYTVSTGVHAVSATVPAGYSASSWGYQCAGSVGSGSATLNLGDNKICIINFDDNPPPAPICADTVMMLDRSLSMFGYPNYPTGYAQWIPDEKAAAKALVDLYAGITSTHPLIGVGRFGDTSGGHNAEIFSVLSSAYATIKTAIENGLPQNPTGYTNLADAIMKGNGELNGPNHQPGKEKVLILISDGDPNEPSTSATVSTGFFSPTGNAQDSSGEFWSNPTGAYADSGAVASDPTSESDQHRFFSFNLPTLPANAVVQGIETKVDAWATTTTMVSTATSVQKNPTVPVFVNQWTNAANGYTSNDVYATSVTNGNAQGYGNFGFTIPANASITGIQVTTEAKVSGGGGSITTPTMYPNGQGADTGWNGSESDVDETTSPSCTSGNRIDSNSNNNRESVNIDISAIPNGSVITSVQVLTWDQGSSGGQYQSFVSVNGSRTNSPSMTVTSTSGCNARTQAIDIPDFAKTSGSDLEVGVQKVGNTTVQVGAIRAIVTYTAAPAGSIALSLSSNNGTSWTSAKSITLDATESLDNPTGNSTSDMWSRSWAPSDFADSKFAVRVQNNSTTGTTVSLDQVNVKVFYSVPTPVTTQCQIGVDLSWNGGTSWTNEKTQSVGMTEASYTLGSPSDDWGSHTWVAGDFANGSNKFIARVRAIDQGSACDNASVAAVDWLQAQVTYTVPSDPVSAALAAADAAKVSDTNIFTIYFGNGNPNLLAQLASGSTANGTHQPGSYNDPNGVTSGSTAWLSPTSNASDSGGDNNGFEGNPSRAYADDNSAAQNLDGAGDRHRYWGYNTNVPPGATITGIEVRPNWWLDSTSGTNSMSFELSYDAGAHWTAAKLDTVESTSQSHTATLGATNDTWGRTWTTSELSSANFRVRAISNSTTASRDFYLDHLPVRISYSVNNENGDGDNFFIAPTSADMKGIFEFIGNQVCPAINNVGAASAPTTASLLVITRSDASVGSGISSTVSVTGQNPSQTSYTASGVDANTPNQNTIIVDPGSYNITQAPVAGFTQSRTDSCSSALGTSGNIAAGEVRTCVLTNTKIPPPPPPPNLTITPGSWQEVPDTNQ